MTPIEELNQLIALLRKYNLPLDANLEAAINQKMADVGGETIESNLKASGNTVNAKQNRYILQFCYAMLTNFKDALSDRDKKISYICTRLYWLNIIRSIICSYTKRIGLGG